MHYIWHMMIEIYDENYEIWYVAELVHLDYEAAAP